MAAALLLDQDWRLFDEVPEATSRVSLRGRDGEGRPVRVGGKETSGVRWRNYLDRVREFGEAHAFEALARFFCNDWNTRHPASQRITHAELVEERQPLVLPDFHAGEARVTRLWAGECGNGRT